MGPNEFRAKLVQTWPSRECINEGLQELAEHWQELTESDRCAAEVTLLHILSLPTGFDGILRVLDTVERQWSTIPADLRSRIRARLQTVVNLLH